VLFIATGEEAATGAVVAEGVDLRGSLLLKTPGAFLPVTPVPGELWAFPGGLPHCVMPRELGAPTKLLDSGGEGRHRVSAAFNVYSRVSTSALAFVQANMPSVLLGRDRAAQVMEALRRLPPMPLPPNVPPPPSSPPPPSPPSPHASSMLANEGDGDVDRLRRERAALAMAHGDSQFVERLLALDSFGAAVLLLRSGQGADGEYVDLYADAHFAQAEPMITGLAVRPGSFESVQRITLRDNAPGNGPHRPKTSTVHQFVLHEHLASALNNQLRRDAIEQSRSSAGVTVSNVGGFHSATTTLDPSHGEAWYAPLATLLREALHAVHRDGLVDGFLIESLDLRGWLNVSSPACINMPHDHGAVAYSAVYFVDDGGAPASSLPSGWSCGSDPQSGRPFYYHRAQQLSQWEVPGGNSPRLARCAGELIFQTQHAAWTNRYAVFSVAPAPGTLYLFPAYMPHCTLPRTLRASEVAPESTELDANSSPQHGPPLPHASLRISAACNIATVASAAPELPTVWQASRMC
jgi:hypothetical protein